MAGRIVTERDFRLPEFRDANVEDYEFRGDGKLVRKDRWERAIGTIRHLVGLTGREFEIPDVVDAVRQLAAAQGGWLRVQDVPGPDDWPVAGYVLEVRLEDGSVLKNVDYMPETRWSWHGLPLPLRIHAWRELPVPPSQA